ncbi:AAEL003538-PA [Aedes aegypti]|uniref:AAEL003538-PA n=1 Tax=Aedes aegypti TaxID=7159 RepID=Q0IG37_AEDAE|nr:AAEL003538-PA [Aedes aegypti]
MGLKKWCIILPYLCSFAICVSALEHVATLKSFDEIRYECSQYLPSSEDEDCSLRCLGLVGRFWNDTIGTPSNSVGRFYRPDSCDQCYLNRTEQCLRRTVLNLPGSAVCQRASNGLLCYKDQYGQLINRAPQFVPVVKLRAMRIFRECAQMLEIPFDKVDRIFKEGRNNTSEGRCLTRCFLIRAGLYSDSRGPDIGRFAVQCEGYSVEYERTLVQCYEGLKAQQLDSCTLATRVLDECIQNNEYSFSDLFDLLEPYLDGVISIGDFRRLELMIQLDNLVIYYPSLPSSSLGI